MEDHLDRRLILGAAGLAGVAALARLSHAGPLTPPGGSVGSTGRTLSEVEPRVPLSQTTTPGDASYVFRITQPGSYFLTAPIPYAGKSAISIVASNVTLDLNGFDVRGPGFGGPIDGIKGLSPGSGVRRAVIRNGVLGGWTRAVNVEHVDSVFEHLYFDVNATGLRTGINTEVLDCSAQGGETGFDIPAFARIARCSSSLATTAGFSVGGGCMLSDCIAWRCGTGFLVLSSGTVLTACYANQCDVDGFNLVSSCIATRCHAGVNERYGFNASYAVIEQCTAQSNYLHGIVLADRCQALNNHCVTNGFIGIGAGIIASGSGNRIEGNHCIGNDNGIVCSNGGNLVIRNSVTGNTTSGYNVPTATNHFGANIFSPAGMTGNSNPHANYEF